MRKLISTTRETTIEEAVQDAISEVESLRDEMNEWRDNIEERFGGTEKYERVSEAADQLDNVQEIDIPESLREMKVTVVSQRKSSKKSPYPRWLRLQNAIEALGAVRSLLEEGTENSLIEDDQKKIDLTDDVEQLMTDVGDAIDNLEGVEFPTMFG